MKINIDMLDVMRKATSLLKEGQKGSATGLIQQVLQRVLPGAQPQHQPDQPVMKDINPPPPGRESSAKAPYTAPSADAEANPQSAGMNAGVPAFVADLLERFGINTPGGSPQPKHGDGPSPAGGQFLSESLTNAAGTRKYKLYVPQAYTGQALPLVVMLHGCTQNPDDFAAGTEMNAQAEQTPCFVLYPAQSESANTSKCWNWFKAIDQKREQGEPSIIADITRKIIASYNINTKQVYVAGLSAGGAMAAIMGHTYPDLYAAVGVHSGLPFGAATDLPSAMQAMRSGMNAARAATSSNRDALPIIVFHGDRDSTVSPRNGEQLIQQQVRAGGRASVETGSVPGGHTYTRTLHATNDGAPLAEQWLIHGAGHAWSGGSSKGTYTDQRGPQATREMMRFFATQTQ
ncbi:extracellular catalytic domain type 1 short-chain-length polyhydroxyalkanoate depolymerase [Actimicrobium antarcticum]|uniref:PHB depolymerase family esterase n=1 Tax=Actimicrobium antarcticum TaxID=1051899 RepID=A0ABP7U114_9BURK